MPEIKNNEYLNAFEKYHSTTSTRYANNILAYCDSHKLKPGSVLDLSCKVGTFLNVFQLSKLKSFGSDISKEMISFSSTKYPKISFKQANVGEIVYKNSFDIIACNFEYINLFPNMLSMSKFFKLVLKHLSNKGFLMITMLSPNMLKTTTAKFNSAGNVDELLEVVNISSTEADLKTTLYNNHDEFTTKTTNQLALYIYSPDDIVDELKRCGFKNCKIVNSELSENDGEEDNSKYYILASKK